MVELENARGMSLVPKLKDEDSQNSVFLKTYISSSLKRIFRVEKISEMVLDPSCQASLYGASSIPKAPEEPAEAALTPQQ